MDIIYRKRSVSHLKQGCLCNVILTHLFHCCRKLLAAAAALAHVRVCACDRACARACATMLSVDRFHFLHQSCIVGVTFPQFPLLVQEPSDVAAQPLAGAKRAPDQRRMRVASASAAAAASAAVCAAAAAAAAAASAAAKCSCHASAPWLRKLLTFRRFFAGQTKHVDQGLQQPENTRQHLRLEGTTQKSFSKWIGLIASSFRRKSGSE